MTTKDSGRDFEHYGSVSNNYDKTRMPAGLEVITGLLYNHGTRLGTPTDKTRLISLGCGTGNYEVELSRHIGKAIGIDIIPEMIKRAKEKSASIPNLDFIVGDATNLPIPDESFDAALFAVSLHHMGGHDVQERALREAYRALRPGGLVVIQTISQRQLRDGFWYFDLIPEAAQKLADRYIPLSDLVTRLENIGFKYGGSTVPIDATFQGEAHFDTDGPFKPEWRAGISVWPLATETEMQNALGRLMTMKKDGTFEEYFRQREALRKDLGQMTFVHAVKK